MRWLIVCLTCHLALWTMVGVCAETESVPGGGAPAETSAGAPEGVSAGASAGSSAVVRESGPPVYYLKDQNGQLVPVLGFKYEDFMRWLRQEVDETPRSLPNPFTIDQAELDGTIEEGQARLDIELTITTRRAGSIRVPIGLFQAVVREEMKYEGDGSAFLDYDTKRQEYVVWIDGKKDQKHKISLAVTIATATIGLDTRLRFDAPRSMRSRMTLEIPETDLEVRAPLDSRFSTVESQTGNAKKTRLTVDSVRGDFQLLWHKSSQGVSKVRTVMSASGEIVVNVGSLDVTCEAMFKVRGRGMPIDRFQIRLPKGTETYEVSEGDYQVIEIESVKPAGTTNGEKPVGAAGAASAVSPGTSSETKPDATGPKESQAARVIEVRLSAPTLEPVLLHLTTTRPIDRSSLDWIEPAGFEVIDAVRQSGHVAMVMGLDYYVSWLPERGVRRVDKLPDTMSVKGPMVAFEYYSAPFLLKARIAPRRTRMSVEPEHVVHVGADQLQIDSTFRYTIRGREVSSLELNLGDWKLDDVGPETLVDANRVDVSQSGQVTIPLLRPTLGHACLTIKAHRAAPQDVPRLAITFPRPLVDSPGPAVVVIQPDDNVKLLPDAAASTGLSRLQTIPSIQLPPRQQLAMYYRGDASQATFSAERSIHQRQVSVDIRSTIAFETLTANVEQWCTYQIDHEPSDQIVLDVPESLLDTAHPEFLVDGVRVTPRITRPLASETSDVSKSLSENSRLASSPATGFAPENQPQAVKGFEGDAEETLKRVPVVLTLEPARIGQCVVTVRYSLPRRVLMPNTPSRRQIPLVLPSKEPISHHELSIITPLGLMVDVLDNPIDTDTTGTSTTNTTKEKRPLGENASAAGSAASGNGASGGSNIGGGGTDVTPSLSVEPPSIEPIVDAMISKADFAMGTRQNFNVTGRLGSIIVLVSIEKRQSTPPTTIHRAFFQTWVTVGEYQNRALFQFQSRQKQIELTMPSTVIGQRIRFFLGGKVVPFESLGDHRYLISFPEVQTGLQQLELRWSSRPSPQRTILSLGMPQLGEDAWIQRWYWQLLLPTREHLVGFPEKVLSESVWKWSGGVFRRTPVMSTVELERWVGSETLSTVIPSANVYLFSSFGASEDLTFRVTDRSMIVLLASGLVLLIGCLLIYLPVVRHPIVLLVLGVVLGGLGVIYTEPMLLGLQAASLGVVLLGMTTLLRRRMTRPKLPNLIPIADSGGSSILDRDSTQRQVILPPQVNSPSHGPIPSPQTTETQFKPQE